MWNHRVATLAALISAGLLMTVANRAEAQYFGRQKVQYDRFDWRVMSTPKFQIHFYPVEELAVRDAGRMAERWYARLAPFLRHDFQQRPLIFYADAPDFQQTNVIGGFIGEGTGGVTEALRSRVIMPLTGSYADNDHVLGHELVHVFQYDIVQSSSPGPGGPGGPGGPEGAGEVGGGGLEGISRLPLWLVEGMAEYLSLGREDPHTAMWMRDAALRGELPTVADLAREDRYFPYRYGQALLAFIGGEWGDSAVVQLFRVAAARGLEPAFQRVLGVPAEELSRRWIEAVRTAYLPAVAGRQRPQDAGDPVRVDNESGAMNLSPSVSPDGRYLAYFGRRDVFTIDLLLADAQTGRVLRRLASPAGDQHYDALSFISSAGTWSPDGGRFAYVVYERGNNRLDIVEVESGRNWKELRTPGIGAIQHPAWSPDGRWIAFSGLKGGISDLYLIDVETGAIRQLTDDRSADLQPAWSPDGRTLAFVSDRVSGTDFNRLVYGEPGLALLDVASGEIRALRVFDGVRHVDPHFSPDGGSLFFIAGRNGFSDIYRLELSSGRAFQLTELATGVSGITPLSPAISVAPRSGRLLFSAFENGGNNIYGMDAARTVGEPVDETSVSAVGTLPPVSAAGTGAVHAYLSDALTGLPATGDFHVEPYSPRLGLEYIGPPTVGVSFGGTGTLVGGSASAHFGDMLGNRALDVGVSAGGTLKDLGAQAVYQNLAHRINWGVGGGRTVYLSGFTGISGGPNPSIDQYMERIFTDQAVIFGRYPLSTTRRFELSGGYSRYSFDREIERYLVDAFGNVVGVNRENVDAPPPLHMFESSTAFVTDNSYFGFTSPLAGSRSRWEVGGSAGTISYYTLLGDYRRYQFIQPVSLAFRGLHYGRYGKDASGTDSDGNRILSPLFLGDAFLIRGYSWGSFSGEECRATPASTGCPAFDRLTGSRVAVGNVELRIPLIGTRQLGLIRGPFLPVEIAPFFDAGVAWSSGDQVDWQLVSDTPSRVPVFSTGLTARLNFFGYLVLEAYYAYPFQRPDKGGHFGFQINPGW